MGGYAFVVPPSPAPGVDDDTPVMTWGDIEGTPLILDATQTPLDLSAAGTGSRFHIQSMSSRESLAHALDVRNKAKKAAAAAAKERQRRGNGS
jgi:protein DGCR14